MLSAGYQMHVPKPIQPAELVTVVASLAKKSIENHIVHKVAFSVPPCAQ